MFTSDSGPMNGETGHVAAGVRHAVDKSASNWVGHRNKYDGDGSSKLLKLGADASAMGKNAIGLQCDKLAREQLNLLCVVIRKAVINPNILSDRPSSSRKDLLKCSRAPLRLGVIRQSNHDPQATRLYWGLRQNRATPPSQGRPDDGQDCAASNCQFHSLKSPSTCALAAPLYKIECANVCHTLPQRQAGIRRGPKWSERTPR